MPAFVPAFDWRSMPARSPAWQPEACSTPRHRARLRHHRTLYWGFSPRLCASVSLGGLWLTLRPLPASSPQIDSKEGTMRKTLLVAMTALAGQLFAGGFYLTLGNPEANPEAKAANAVLVL